MGTKQELVLVDTNIFVIDLRYKRDTNFTINRAFLDHIEESKNGFTTIVNQYAYFLIIKNETKYFNQKIVILK